MAKVFIVVERRAHEGDTVIQVFKNFKEAVATANGYTYTAEQNGKKMEILYDVLERVVY
jgi:hypothetical protein